MPGAASVFVRGSNWVDIPAFFRPKIDCAAACPATPAAARKTLQFGLPIERGSRLCHGPFRLDGPIVVNGVLTIPLPARSDNSSDPSTAGRTPRREFIAGAENALAAAVVHRLLAARTTEFAPLVLYGPHGSGKSHLARGLAAEFANSLGVASALCLAGSEFAQCYLQAIDEQRLEAWRAQIHSADLLVLEDLGQLSSHRGAQRELALALDALADRSALVVVTARHLPSYSQSFLPALRSRLSAGLTIPLTLPGPAARRVILEQLAAERGLTLSKRTLHRVADSLHANVPGLVAAVLKLELATRASSQPEGRPLLDEQLAELNDRRLPELREIAALVAKYYGLRVADLKSPQRRRQLVSVRGVAMYLARQLTGRSLQEIGRFFGRRDHTTVLNAFRRTEQLARGDRATRQALVEIKRLLVAS